MQTSYSPLVFVRLLFGGIFNSIGWFFLVIGLIFTYVFDIPGTIDGFVNFQGELAEAKGVITGTSATNFSENNQVVYEVHFKFRENNGETLENYSFSVDPPAEGDEVIIEYNPANPYYSRVQGLRFSQAPIWISFILIFPLIGLIFVLINMAKGAATIGLIRKGLLTSGVLKSKSKTAMRVNNQPVYKLTFEFQARDGRRYSCDAKTNYPANLEDEERERILYNPDNPDKAVLVDSLPLNLKSEGGTYIFSSKGGYIFIVLNLILPVAALIILYNMFS